MTRALSVHVDDPSCTRCGACVAICPSVFEVDERVSRVLRQPHANERSRVDAARFICPTDAIRVDRGEEDEAGASEIDRAPIFDELARGAERVRWTLESLRLQDVDASRAPAELRLVVREMAFSENATYSATQRFLDSFFDDVDFSQWVSVWFYEETRHPHVLVEWLRRVGEPPSNDFIVKGRVSTPFMRSVVGTLVTNVISEVTAAQAYRHLARTSPEPVLSRVARCISGDEARHAASFYRFAERLLAASAPDAARRDRARGLEVLQAWLGGASPTTHPVAQMIERLDAHDDAPLGLDFKAVRARVVRVVGLLLGVPLRRDEDVAPALKQLLRGEVA